MYHRFIFRGLQLDIYRDLRISFKISPENFKLNIIRSFLSNNEITQCIPRRHHCSEVDLQDIPRMWCCSTGSLKPVVYTYSRACALPRQSLSTTPHTPSPSTHLRSPNFTMIPCCHYIEIILYCQRCVAMPRRVFSSSPWLKSTVERVIARLYGKMLYFNILCVVVFS